MKIPTFESFEEVINRFGEDTVLRMVRAHLIRNGMFIGQCEPQRCEKCGRFVKRGRMAWHLFEHHKL